ncbi:hypothetical protein [Kitasatospora sp. NPDC002965]|uniref:hypothetical protein n=1 Tax=Kitasatospora sp. NPDC002965 TaxID=3154775 RepID=UPI0033AA844F
MTDSTMPHDSAASGAAPAGPAAPEGRGTAEGDVTASATPEAVTASPASPAPPVPAASDRAPGDDAGDGPGPGENPWTAPGATVPGPVEPPSAEELAARRTRRRKAALRWGAAVVVCALAGTGSALAVTAPERTDLPGLATESDGRYTFPALVLPPLPSGKPVPRENKSRHAADLRYLLLPAPQEAGGSLAPVVFPTPTPPPTGSPTGSPTGGPTGTLAAASPTTSAAPPPATASTPPATAPLADWVTCDAVAAEQKDPAAVRSLLLESACRAATVREWTATDGTRTQIRLLAFGSSAAAWDVYRELRDGDQKDPGSRTTPMEGWDTVFGVAVETRGTPATTAGTALTARLAYLSAGDLVGVVTMTNPGGVPAEAFRQVVTLQSDLLA